MSPPPGTLWVVATPIGNLEDITLRAVRTLSEVSRIYAEDSRHTRKLLSHLGIGTKLQSLHAHNEAGRIGEVLGHLEAGNAVALVTDAGTPCISDPGHRIVAATLDAGLTVAAVPGPSALTTLLSVCGFDLARGFDFHGFLPRRGPGRTSVLSALSSASRPSVLYEAPHRIQATLKALAGAAPGRGVVVGRELTKLHEEVLRGTAEGLAALYDSQSPRGEFVLALAPAPPAEIAADPEVQRVMTLAQDAGLSRKDAAALTAALLRIPRRQAYAEGL